MTKEPVAVKPVEAWAVLEDNEIQVGGLFKTKDAALEDAVIARRCGYKVGPIIPVIISPAPRKAKKK